MLARFFALKLALMILGMTLGMTSGVAPAHAQDKIGIVATTSIIADLVRNVGGERVEVKSLVAPGADAHVYSPTPLDAKTIADARIVVANGLGLEGWLSRLVKASGTKAAQVIATNGIKPIEAEDDHGHQGHDAKKTGHGKQDDESFDPHAWQSVPNVKVYVVNIRDALIKADPEGRSVYEANARAYITRLDALDLEIRLALGRIPEERRKVITTHDAFGYFEQAYGLAFIAPQGVSTEAEISAKDIARIITQIKKQKIPAVFLENVADPRLMQRVSAETGAKVGGTLYSDALSDDKGPAPTYLDMMRHNLRQFGAALNS